MKSPFRIGVGRFINGPAMYKRGVAPDQSCDCGAGVRTKYISHTRLWILVRGSADLRRCCEVVVRSVGFQVCLHVSTEFNVQLGTNKIWHSRASKYARAYILQARYRSGRGVDSDKSRGQVNVGKILPACHSFFSGLALRPLITTA